MPQTPITIKNMQKHVFIRFNLLKTPKGIVLSFGPYLAGLQNQSFIRIKDRSNDPISTTEPFRHWFRK